MPENISQIRGLVDAWQFINEVEPFWGPAILLMVFVITFLALKSVFEAKRSFASAVFLTLVIGVWLRSIDLISNTVLALPVVGIILAVLWLKTDD